MNNLAGSYTEVGRHAEALKLYEQAVQRMKGKIGPEHPDTLLATTNLALSLVRAGRGGEAVPIIDDCLAHAAGKILDPRLLPTLIDLRPRHFERTKSAAGCRATAELWEKLKRTDPGSLL